MKRHAFDLISFVFGAIFLGIGVTYLITDSSFTSLEARWIWPALLLAVGIAFLAPARKVLRPVVDPQSLGLSDAPLADLDELPEGPAGSEGDIGHVVVGSEDQDAD